MIEWNSAELTVKAQAELLGLNRTSLYYQPAPVSAEELALKRRLDELYTAHPFYGSPKLTAQLHGEGWAVNHKRGGALLAGTGAGRHSPGAESQ